MSQRGVLYQWTAVVAKRFETLALSQAKALAAFSLGLGLAQRCALSAVAGKLYSLGNVRWSAGCGASSAIRIWSWPVAVRCCPDGR